MDDGLRPFKRDGLPIMHFHKPVDRFARLAWRGETGATQSSATEDAEPALHLIQLQAADRSVMQMDVGASLQPAILFRLVGVQVVRPGGRNPRANFAKE